MMGDAGAAGRRREDDPATLALDDRLRERLAMISDDPDRTWADRVADALITAAVEGDLKSWEFLAKRVGQAPNAAAKAAPEIDDETARRILEVVRGPVNPR